MGDAGDGGNGDGYKNGGSEGSRKVAHTTHTKCDNTVSSDFLFCLLVL